MTAQESPNADLDYDVIIVGAGFAGLNALHRIRVRTACPCACSRAPAV